MRYRFDTCYNKQKTSTWLHFYILPSIGFEMQKPKLAARYWEFHFGWLFWNLIISF